VVDLQGWNFCEDKYGLFAERGGVTLRFSAGAIEVDIEPQLEPGGCSHSTRFPDEWSVPIEVIDALRAQDQPQPTPRSEGGQGIAALDLPKPITAYRRRPR
jgi:hypothetical protein